MSKTKQDFAFVRFEMINHHVDDQMHCLTSPCGKAIVQVGVEISDAFSTLASTLVQTDLEKRGFTLYSEVEAHQDHPFVDVRWRKIKHNPIIIPTISITVTYENPFDEPKLISGKGIDHLAEKLRLGMGETEALRVLSKDGYNVIAIDVDPDTMLVTLHL